MVAAEQGAAEQGNALCIYMMLLPNETYFFADCTVNIDPEAERLAGVTLATARFVKSLGIEPQIAFYPFARLRGPANVLIFWHLNAANIC